MEKGGNILEQNQFNSLQMIQYECPRVIHPSVTIAIHFSYVGSSIHYMLAAEVS